MKACVARDGVLSSSVDSDDGATEIPHELTRIFVVEKKNPYSPPTQSVAAPDKWEQSEVPSTWSRNIKACTAVVIGYSSFAFLLALSGKTVPETAVAGLAGFAGAASAWANVRLGPSIGWSRGGLPIVLVTVFAGMVGYMGMSLMAAALIVSWLSPTWHFYTP